MERDLLMSATPGYITVDELFENLRPTSIAKDVSAAVAAEKRSKIIDEDQLRRDQNWSALGHQVVGAEV